MRSWLGPTLWLTLAACSVEPLGAPEQKSCPCAEGWVCDPETSRCVRQLPPTFCDEASDCSGPCDSGACVEGLCERAASGTPSRYPAPFDCSRDVCNERGEAVAEVDPADFYDDGNECTIESCGPNGREVAFAPERTPCTADGGKLCSLGACVECIAVDDCPTGDLSCVGSYCVVPDCEDGLQQAFEPSIDCGAPLCPPCPTGEGCFQDFNCASSVCENETCVESCSDLVKNGDESDIDCGGGCAPCAQYQRCNAGADCISGTCAGVCL